eukprot:2333278-Ditylum_brightwellii.AAC.1
MEKRKKRPHTVMCHYDRSSNILKQPGSTRYSYSTQVVLNRGTEFIAEFTEMIASDYGVKKKPNTARNPQANSIIERTHQTIGNTIGLFEVHDTSIDEKDPWTEIISAVRFAPRDMVHTIMQATPMQLVFGKDAILNVKHQANWKYINERKEKLIKKKNEQENKKRNLCHYQHKLSSSQAACAALFHCNKTPSSKMSTNSSYDSLVASTPSSMGKLTKCSFNLIMCKNPTSEVHGCFK